MTKSEDSEYGLVALYQEHASGLAGAVHGVLGRRVEVQEVLQESFLRAWRAAQGGFQPSDPKAWIFVVTLNTAKDLRRRFRTRADHEEASDMERGMVQGRTPPPSHALECAEATEAARSAILDLRDPLKEVFLLRVSGGLSFEAVARSLDIPVGTAKTRMRKALQRLRVTLSEFAPVLDTGKETP